MTVSSPGDASQNIIVNKYAEYWTHMNIYEHRYFIDHSRLVQDIW